MTTSLRACVALVSFALSSALFGSSDIDIDVSSGQQLEIQLAGTSNTEIWVTKLGAGGGQVAYIWAAPEYTNTWSYNYYWYPWIYQSGVTFQASPYSPYYSSYRGSLYGLSAGTYRVTVRGDYDIPEYYRSEGPTSYIFQGSYYYDLWIDYSFEAY